MRVTTTGMVLGVYATASGTPSTRSRCIEMNTQHPKHGTNGTNGTNGSVRPVVAPEIDPARRFVEALRIVESRGAHRRRRRRGLG